MENNIENNNVEETTMTRKDFLKKTALGAVSLAFLGKFGFSNVKAATVTDNLDAKGTHVGTTPPANTSMTWIDTGNAGVMKYYIDGAWKPICPTWHN